MEVSSQTTENGTKRQYDYVMTSEGVMPNIVSIAYKPADIESKPPDRFARVPVETVELVAEKGIAGDRKGTGRERHLNVMARDTLDGLTADGCKTAPGEMGEQIVVAGIDIDCLPAGTRLRFGSEAVIEVVNQRTGCERLEHIQKIAIRATTGRLGVMCRVERGGTIRVGDEVEVVRVE
ncbi:MAG TPA: MOSC domain-containing protein [Gemmataceae bacterium]|nr:MOSC domain-containing protein [Gemmataceae bacterium]